MNETDIGCQNANMPCFYVLIFAFVFHSYLGTYESVFLEKLLRFQTSYSMLTINIPDCHVLFKYTT